MAIYERPDSPFYWMLIERAGQKPLRKSTGVLAAAPTPKQRAEQKALSEEVYRNAQADLIRKRMEPAAKPEIAFREYAAWYETNVAAHKRGVKRERSMIKNLGALFGDTTLPSRTTAWPSWVRAGATRRDPPSRRGESSRRAGDGARALDLLGLWFRFLPGHFLGRSIGPTSAHDAEPCGPSSWPRVRALERDGLRAHVIQTCFGNERRWDFVRDSESETAAKAVGGSHETSITIGIY